MAFVNYITDGELRASAATSGAAEQDDAYTLPESTQACWVTVEKTAEANADNLLTVRLQCQVNSVWYDVPWEFMQAPAAVATAGGVATVVDRTTGPNILDADSTVPSYSITAYYKSLPSNVIRTISISSGTGAANTWSAEVAYMVNQL